MKKQWYDYLWIFSLTYLILGFFNILSAWLGLICFFVPLIISFAQRGQKDIVTVTAAENSCSDCWAVALAFPGKRIFPNG